MYTSIPYKLNLTRNFYSAIKISPIVDIQIIAAATIKFSLARGQLFINLGVVPLGVRTAL